MNSGIAFHCHHDRLWEFVYDFKERVKVIKNNKPAEEQELRLKLFRLIPLDKLPLKAGVSSAARDKARDARDKARDGYNKAWDARNKAWDAYNKAWDAYNKAWDARNKAWDAYNKAWDAYNKARDACDKAWDAYVSLIDPVGMVALHKELCPGCPWDGTTIFTRKKD